MRNSHRACLDQVWAWSQKDAGSTSKSHHTEKALDGVSCGLQGASEPTCTILCVFSWARMHGSPSILKLRVIQAYEPRHSDEKQHSKEGKQTRCPHV